MLCVQHDSVTVDNVRLGHVDAVGMTRTAERRHVPRSAGRTQRLRVGSRIAGTLVAASALMLIVSCSAGTDPDGADLSTTSDVAATTTSAPVSSSTPQSGSAPTALPDGAGESGQPGPATAVPPISPAQLTPQVGSEQGRCTDQINYADDPRSNAEINSIGESTGTCPQPIEDDRRCTDQIDYAGDPRSNAEINSIGESTGTCPQPINSAPAPPTP